MLMMLLASRGDGDKTTKDMLPLIMMMSQAAEGVVGLVVQQEES